MSNQASDLARRLAEQAELVCRHYLSNGRRVGHYWIVGDVRNAPGRSTFVRLRGSGVGKGAAGKWTDAATGEYGDLLDVIRESCGFVEFGDVLAEARRFLSLPRLERHVQAVSPITPALRGSPESARRLFAMSKPIHGTIAEAYLRTRGISALPETTGLRFHPRCYYTPGQHLPTETWPALIGAVTTLDGIISGVHRTWLDPVRGRGKAPVDTPRRAMGFLLGQRGSLWRGATTCLPPARASRRCYLYAVRYRPCRRPLPFPPITSQPCCCRRASVGSISLATLDAAGDAAQAVLAPRAEAAGIEAIALSPRLGDFNEDLHVFGLDALRAALRIQLAPEDVDRFLLPATRRIARLPSIDADSSVAAAQCRRGPRPRPSRGRSDGRRPGPAMAEVRLFSAARRRKDAHIIYGTMARFASRSKIAAPLPSSAGASALRCRSGCWPVPPAV